MGKYEPLTILAGTLYDIGHCRFVVSHLFKRLSFSVALSPDLYTEEKRFHLGYPSTIAYTLSSVCKAIHVMVAV